VKNDGDKNGRGHPVLDRSCCRQPIAHLIIRMPITPG